MIAAKTYRTSGKSYRSRITYRGYPIRVALFGRRNPIGAPTQNRFKREDVVLPSGRVISRITTA